MVGGAHPTTKYLMLLSNPRVTTGVALLEGALAPALIFTALNFTTVNNVILIGRIEPPLTLALSVLLLRERVNSWVVGGAIASFIGVVLTIVLQPPAEPIMEMEAGFKGI